MLHLFWRDQEHLNHIKLLLEGQLLERTKCFASCNKNPSLKESLTKPRRDLASTPRKEIHGFAPL